MPDETIEPFFHLRKDAGLIIGLPVRDDSGRYHTWHRHEDKWFRMQPSDLVESDYFGKNVARPEDVYFEFIDFMYQRCRNRPALTRMDCIRNDMHNLSACLRKLEIYHSDLMPKGHHVERFVVTEIEYIVSVCRSLYDLLQLIAGNIWDGIELLDPGVKKNALKESFADMAIKDKTAMPPEVLQTKYGLTPNWSAFYANESDFFIKLRKFRNDINHGGQTPGYIFPTPHGFAVDAKAKGFSLFSEIWKPETFLKNDLAPVRPILAHIIQRTFGAMVNFIALINREIKFPEDIAPGYHVFMRGHYIDRLAKLNNYMTTEIWNTPKESAQ